MDFNRWYYSSVETGLKNSTPYYIPIYYPLKIIGPLYIHSIEQPYYYAYCIVIQSIAARHSTDTQGIERGLIHSKP